MKKQAKDYTVYTVTGKAARWKREIIVNKGQVWVPGTRENLMRAMFSGWPILTVEGKPRIRIDDLISSGDFSGGTLAHLVDIRDRYKSGPTIG